MISGAGLDYVALAETEGGRTGENRGRLSNLGGDGRKGRSSEKGKGGITI